jgi:hypothetical protein
MTVVHQQGSGAMPNRRRWFRFPFVLATVFGIALLVVAAIGLFQSIRFSAGGVIVQARVLFESSKRIGSSGGYAGRPRWIYSRRVDYEFEDLDGTTRAGSDGWNGRKLARGDLLEVEFLRADPETNRVHPDSGSDWFGDLLLLAGGVFVLAIPRFSKTHSKREEWEEFERERRARQAEARLRTPGELPTRGMVFAFLGCIAAFVITAWAAICVVATFATNNYWPILAQATGWSLLSLLMLLAAWSRLERGPRILALVIAVTDVAVLFEATVRWIGIGR